MSDRDGGATGIEKSTWAAVIVTVAVWSSAFAGIRAGLKGYSPESLALLRYFVASIIFAIFAIIRRMPLPEKRDLPALIGLGFLGFTAYNILLNAGEVGVSAGVASFIIASAPVHMALLARVLHGERLSAWGWGGILVSFAGVAVISISGSEGFQLSIEALLVVAAAFISALYSVAQKPYAAKYGALRFVTYAVWTGTAFLMVFAPGLLSEMQTAPPDATLAVIYTGIFPGAIGYTLWSYVLARMPASLAGSFLYLIPALAAIIAWAWLGETLDPSSLLGGVLILAGVIVVNRRGQAKISEQAQPAND
jgi:drug/metabolite transporter (DMT)-like permease